MKDDPVSQGGAGLDSGQASASDRQQIVDLEFLRGLISAVDASGIDSLEISRGGTRIRLAKSPAVSAGGGSAAHMVGAPGPAYAPPPPAAPAPAAGAVA